MQRSASKLVEIKCGIYGLGAFACQTMKPGTFLGNYVGHILTNELAEKTIELAKHTLLNYLFEVTPDEPDVQLSTFDAAYLGNATRFLNHAEKGKANVEARITLVIGEHQLGFFTTKKVKAGDELLLDYGESYWKGKDSDPDPS
ncbi:SET domain-containing protein [Imleria badia]|nr:SET domain-containing protein [Imleria badia]